MRWIKLQKMLAIVSLGGMPFATVSSCDYGPGGSALYLDRNVGGFYDPGYGIGYPSGVDVIVEDVYYEEDIYYEEDVYYDDYWYEEDEYWYEDEYYYEDDFFDFFGWF